MNLYLRIEPEFIDSRAFKNVRVFYRDSISNPGGRIVNMKEHTTYYLSRKFKELKVLKSL